MAEEQQTETQEEQTIEVPQEYADARPEWLPEKFNSPEDLANSYTNLESKIGQIAVKCFGWIQRGHPQQCGGILQSVST